VSLAAEIGADVLFQPMLLRPCKAFSCGVCLRHMKAALGALEQLNAIAWQHADALDHVAFPQQKTGGQHASMQRSESMDKLKRSLSMPDQITRDIARPLLASAFDEVSSACWADTIPMISNDIAVTHRVQTLTFLGLDSFLRLTCDHF